MLKPEDMTKFQKIVTGFKIFEEYLSPKDNPGEVLAGRDVIWIRGVHHEALGGDDHAKLKAMGWTWSERGGAWEFKIAEFKL